MEATLIGAGLGVELIFKRNLNVRVDWGIAIEGVEARDVKAGSSEVYVVATFMF